MVTPFKQIYIVTMQNGDILRVVVNNARYPHGREQAKTLACEFSHSVVYDVCASTQVDEIPEGVTRLQG